MYKCKNNVIITIGRTFGSGGREIGQKVAEELEIPFYDKELLELAVKEGNVSLNDLRVFDEKMWISAGYSTRWRLTHTQEMGRRHWTWQ